MLTADQIISEALYTHDAVELFRLVDEALKLAKFEQSKAEFAEIRAKKLAEQVQRQTELITNLEKTLWSKK